MAQLLDENRLNQLLTWANSHFAKSTDLTNSDWNENDSTKKSYVQNRTHYTEGSSSISIFNGEFTTSENYLVIDIDNWSPFFEGNDEYEVYVDGEVITSAETHNIAENITLNKETSYSGFNVYSGWLTGSGETGDIKLLLCPNPAPSELESFAGKARISIEGSTTLTSANISCSIEGEETVHQLDAKYIPDTIARTSQLPTKTSELTNDSGYITKDVDNLTNYTKTENLATVATTGDYNDLTTKLTIIDDTTHSDTDKPLSANQGKALSERIENLESRGKFLSLWDCTTGLPETDPTTNDTYPYTSGDYYVVGKVGTTNYKPDGSSYTPRQASTVVESNIVNIEDIYYYDGSVWTLQSNTQKLVTFTNIAGLPTDNTNLATALNAKQDTITSTTDLNTNDINVYGNLNMVGNNSVANLGKTEIEGALTQTNGSCNLDGVQANSLEYLEDDTTSPVTYVNVKDKVDEIETNIDEIEEDVSTIETTIADMVTKSTEQNDISGKKTFTNVITLSSNANFSGTSKVIFTPQDNTNINISAVSDTFSNTLKLTAGNTTGTTSGVTELNIFYNYNSGRKIFMPSVDATETTGVELGRESNQFWRLWIKGTLTDNTNSITVAQICAKQNALDANQLLSVNSGITATKVSTYDGYATTISNLDTRITTLETTSAVHTTAIETNTTNISSLQTEMATKVSNQAFTTLEARVATAEEEIDTKQDELSATNLLNPAFIDQSFTAITATEIDEIWNA